MRLQQLQGAKYTELVKKLREYCLGKGFEEVHTQSNLSILAACEDPTTIQTFYYGDTKWPLPQTGQMWLEAELLEKPSLPGVFCISTSYRYEPNPIPGRHDLIFPMFEFELQGEMEELRRFCAGLVETVGIGQAIDYRTIEYADACELYNVKTIEANQEELLRKDLGSVVFLQNFTETSSPFWNMKRNGDKAEKLDVIIDGIETIGSAVRSCDKDEMFDRFMTISDGKYAGKLFDLFGETRVMEELNVFLSHHFFPRCGGGIGLTRLLRAVCD